MCNYTNVGGSIRLCLQLSRLAASKSTESMRGIVTLTAGLTFGNENGSVIRRLEPEFVWIDRRLSKVSTTFRTG